MSLLPKNLTNLSLPKSRAGVTEMRVTLFELRSRRWNEKNANTKRNSPRCAPRLTRAMQAVSLRVMFSKKFAKIFASDQHEPELARFQLSPRAKADLAKIADYTEEMWGVEQAIKYLDGIERCCLMLAQQPTLGRSCSHLRAGLRRMESGRHVIFYRETPDGILVSRILHQGMEPARHAN